MKYLQIILLLCLLVACDAPTKIKHPNFDLRLSYIDSLKVGDTLSQAYLEAFIALRRRDSLPNIPVNLDTARVWYAEEQDNYPSTQFPLSYIFSTDTVDIFWKNDSIRCTRVPALSSKNIQVYTQKIFHGGYFSIRTHKPNPSDKNNLIEFLIQEFFYQKNIVLAKQANGYWKFVKETDVGKFGDSRYWTPEDKLHPVSVLSEQLHTGATHAECWDEAAFEFRRIPAEIVSKWDYSGGTTEIRNDIIFFPSMRLVAIKKDSLHITYKWIFRHDFRLKDSLQPFEFGGQLINPKEESQLMQAERLEYESFKKEFSTFLLDEDTLKGTRFNFITEIDSLETVWAWNDSLKSYFYHNAKAANGLYAHHLKMKMSKKAQRANPNFDFEPLPTFRALRKKYPNIPLVSKDSLVFKTWQILEHLYNK